MLDEYAIRFYFLLDESFKIDAQDRLEDIQILGLPNFKNKSDVDKVIRSYEKQAALVEQSNEPPLISVLKGRRNGPQKQ